MKLEIHEENNLHFCSLCQLRPRERVGQKALADMSAKNVSFFTAPLRKRGDWKNKTKDEIEECKRTGKKKKDGWRNCNKEKNAQRTYNLQNMQNI